MHAGVISGCISRRLMNYTGIQGISQCIHNIYNTNSLLQAIFLIFYHTPQLDDPPSLSYTVLSGPTPAMPRSPKLYSTSSLPAPTKPPTTDPNDDPRGWSFGIDPWSWLMFPEIRRNHCFVSKSQSGFSPPQKEDIVPHTHTHTILWLSFSNRTDLCFCNLLLFA